MGPVLTLRILRTCDKNLHKSAARLTKISQEGTQCVLKNGNSATPSVKKVPPMGPVLTLRILRTCDKNLHKSAARLTKISQEGTHCVLKDGNSATPSVKKVPP